MKIERDERKFDFHGIGLAIKKAREREGMTQEQLGYIVDRDPRTIMYHENDGQHPSLNAFYQMVTMFGISVDEYFYPDMGADAAAKKRINIQLNSLNESELRLVEGIINAIKVVMPCGHPLAENSAVAIEALEGLPFLLLEHGGRTEVSDLLERSGVHPDVRFTTWEDFAIMAMAERGLGVGILPDIILRRIPYKLEIRPLSIPYYRSIGLAVKDQAHLTPAVTKFIEYLPLREEAQPTLL